MTVTSGFFNSVSGDRKYDAEDMGRIFDGIMEDGVHKGLGTEFAVVAKGALNLGVGEGRAWFNETWLLNDSELPVAATAAHSSLARIDAIVLEIDRSAAVRAGSIKYKAGTPSGTPVRPTMTQTTTIHQYPIAYITRAANSTVISQGHITNMVGTPEFPYAVSRLLDRNFEPAWMHRNTFRGKNLGASFTPAQKQAILNGSFDDLYVGDYWEINGVKWRIVDINYYLNRGALTGHPDSVVTKNHVMVMPDSTIRRCRMNESFGYVNSTGYWGSSFRIFQLGPIKDQIVAAFGAAATNLLQYGDMFITSMSSASKPVNAIHAAVQVELPSTSQIFGSNWFGATADGANIPPQISKVGADQLALFRLAPQFIRAEPNIAAQAGFPAGDTFQTRFYWLNDPVSATNFAIVGAGAAITNTLANEEWNARPLFGLIGS